MDFIPNHTPSAQTHDAHVEKPKIPFNIWILESKPCKVLEKNYKLPFFFTRGVQNI